MRTSLLRATAALGVASLCLSSLAASAQQPAATMKIGEDPISVMMKWRPTAEPPEMPDFVKRTRPPENQLDYTPLTGTEPKRPPRKTPAELAATMQKLDSAGARARGQAAAFPTPKPIVRRPRPPDPDPPTED